MDCKGTKYLNDKGQKKKQERFKFSCLVVPKAGIEPARVLPHWFLRPTRLPIPPLRLGMVGFDKLSQLRHTQPTLTNTAN